MIEMLLTAFAVSSMAAIVCRYYKFPWYKFTKPVPLLILWVAGVLILQNNSSSAGLWLIVAGLFFGWLGDIFLLKEKLFLAGLAAFLIGHIAYAVFFLNQYDMVINWKALPVVIVSLAYGSFLVKNLIKRNRIKYVVPVILYVLTIAGMVYGGLFSDSLAIIAGVILFAFSDSVLGYDKFIAPFRAAQLLILTTYFAGQFLIFFGTFHSLLS